MERGTQGKIREQATGQSHRMSATVGRRQVGHIWVGQCAVAEVPFSQRTWESWKVGRCLASGQSRKTPLLRFLLGRGQRFSVLLRAGERREGWLQRDSCTCNADGEPVQYLWISDLVDLRSTRLGRLGSLAVYARPVCAVIVSAARMEGRWELEARGVASTVHKFCGELQGTRIQCDVDGQDAGFWLLDGEPPAGVFFSSSLQLASLPGLPGVPGVPGSITVGPPAGSKPPTGEEGGVWRRVCELSLEAR